MHIPKMAMTLTVSTDEMAKLVCAHLGILRQENPSWELRDSPMAGRGIFALRDIAEGEEIFRDHPLLIGPTARKGTKLNTCVICYRLLEGPIEQVLCTAGCSLPVCKECSQSPRHAIECEIFRKWRPKDLTKITPESLRILSVVRCFFLDDLQRKLLYGMQANADKYYKGEVQRAADCFEHFPKESDMLQYFYRTVCAYNTNAFECHSKVDGNELTMRALFPLASLLNHACIPNAGHDFVNTDTMVVTATRPIAKDEEITTSYTKVLWSNLARKMFLVMTKHFICQCKRCEDPTFKVREEE